MRLLFRKIKTLIRRLAGSNEISPFIKSEAPQVTSRVGWSGNYTNWNEAKASCTGYNSELIFEKVKHNTLKVKNGEAEYERDSVTFDEPQHNWPLFAFLEKLSIEKGLHLNIIDFGGALGSTYNYIKKVLPATVNIRWNIIEQERFVAIGKEFFETENLKFYNSIEECLAATNPTIILFSGVLQYLPEPTAVIEQAVQKFDHIIIDRTNFIVDRPERLTVQVVPEWIYQASYPCTFFNEKDFIQKFVPPFSVEAKFDSYCDGEFYLEDGAHCVWKGLYFRRKP